MIRSLAKDALARTAFGVDESPTVRSVDPIASLLARRMARRAFRAAEQATTSNDVGHIARLAFLRLARAERDVPPDDIEAVGRAFAAISADGAPVRRGGPWLTLGACTVLVSLGIAAGLVAWLTRPFDPHREPLGHTLGDETSWLSRRARP